MKHILIIKLGAIGDFIQATAALADIRAHHKGDHITLLTTQGMLPLAQHNPHIDAISLDSRGKFWNLSYLKELRQKLKGFDMVYDLQTNDRTNLYHLLAGKPQWNGIALGCSHPQKNPLRNQMHSLERIADQLNAAGVKSTHTPNIAYMAEDVSDLLLKNNLTPQNYTLIFAGGSAHRPEKRWPHFTALVNEMIQKGERVVLIGGPAEAKELESIQKNTGAINLCGQTSLSQLVGLCVHAKQFIGNDTGPAHMAAASGASGVVIFGSGSDPKLCAPKSEHVHILYKNDIAAISPQEALQIISA